MTTGFVQRFKGKIAVVWGGIWQQGTKSSAAFHNAGAPTNGTSGTLAGIAGIGALLIDTTNGVLYQNTNTLASPTWTALTTATGAGTYTGTFDGIVGGTTPAAGTFTNVIATGFADLATGNALTAAGTTRADALALTKQINRVTTAGASTGVTLPASATVGIGGTVVLFNDGANPLKVYAAGSDTIDATAGATGVTLTNAKRCVYTLVAANTFISAQLGVVSA